MVVLPLLSMGRKSDWPIHEFRTYRESKGWSAEKVCAMVEAINKELAIEPRTLEESIELGYRGVKYELAEILSDLTGNIVSVSYFMKFPVRPRSRKMGQAA